MEVEAFVRRKLSGWAMRSSVCDRVIRSAENCLTESKETRTWEEGSVTGTGVGASWQGDVTLSPGARSWPPGYGA